MNTKPTEPRFPVAASDRTRMVWKVIDEIPSWSQARLVEVAVANGVSLNFAADSLLEDDWFVQQIRLAHARRNRNVRTVNRPPATEQG